MYIFYYLARVTRVISHINDRYQIGPEMWIE